MKDYILDTDICSYIMLNSSDTLLKNLELHKDDSIHITSITYAELLYGAFRKDSKKIQNKISHLLNKVKIIDFDERAAIEYAKIRTKLEKDGIPIGGMDILIAACAISNKFVLVTNNLKHFSRIDHLQIQNWFEPDEH
jgi:tRNA(fMet)-specific endonuclease VapC